jgi:hypothetical protein
MTWFERFLFYLGHGRALEMYLIGVKLLFGIFIVPPWYQTRIVALADLGWYISDPIIAVPFFFIGVVQLCGWIMNVKGYESSWAPRAAGAGLAIMLWLWLIFKSVLIGAVSTGIMPFCIMSCIGSIWLFWKAWNRLPIPGMMGLP